MPAIPLTHHEILELVEPFARRGRRVDLAATDRLERRLAFHAVEHPADPAGRPALRETLELYSFGTGTYRLRRGLELGRGLGATLEAVGTRPDELLARIESVPPDRQVVARDGHLTVLDYAVEAGDGPTDRAVPDSRLVLTRAVAPLDGACLTLSLSGVRGVAAEVVLTAPPGTTLDVPEDLLAVLGWDWAPLRRTPAGWAARLRLRGDSVRRSRRAEVALGSAAAHVAATLAAPPARFHDQWRSARWGVVLRRAIPVLTVAGLLLAIAAIPRFSVVREPGLWMVFFHVPTALIALSLCMQEQARFEIPPRPRRSRASAWRRALPVGPPRTSAAAPH